MSGELPWHGTLCAFTFSGGLLRSSDLSAAASCPYPDAGRVDAGNTDAGNTDAGSTDGGVDAGSQDGGA